MGVMERVREKARMNKKRIVLPEGDETRTVRAAAQLRDEGLAEPVLLGREDLIRAAAEKTVFANVILSTTCEQLNVNTRPPGATRALAAAFSRW